MTSGNKKEKDVFKANPLNPNVPNHCRQCGGRMIKGKVKINKHDSETGKIIATKYTLKCENYTGLKLRRLLPSNYHDDFLIIEDPNFHGITGKPHRTILTKGF